MGAAAHQEETQDDAQYEAEVSVATELSTHFKRVLDGIRTYPKGHPTLKGYYGGLLERMSAQVSGEFDEYTFSVTPLGFSVHNVIVNKAEKLSESITHPLYLDGLKNLTFERGVTDTELLAFMEIWRATLDEQLGDTHTFSTRVWEAELDHLHITSTDTFGDGGKGADGRSAKDRLAEAVDELSGNAPMPLAGDDAQPGNALGKKKLRRMTQVSKEDLRQLKARGIPELSEGDLQRMAAGERAKPPGLSPLELEALGKELLAQHDRVIERVFDAVFLVALDCTAAEQDALSNALGLVLAALMRTGQLDRVKDNLMRQVAAARSGPPTTLDARFQSISRLLKVLQRPTVLGPIVEALDQDERRDAAIVVLKFLPAKSVGVLLDWLVAPERPAAIKVLSELIAAVKPDAVDLALRLAWSDEELALELLRIATPLGVGSWPVRKAALAHVSLKVQIAAIKGLDKTLLISQRLELLSLLSSPIAEIRTELFAPFVATHDKAVAPALCTMLRRAKLEESERRRVLMALGTLGGPEAGATLRQYFTESTDIQLKCTLANALAQAGDEKARPLLEAAAKKLFFGGPLKVAAKAALSRLDALKKDKGATT